VYRQVFGGTEMTSDNVTLAQLVMHKGEIVSEIYGPQVTAQTTLISWSMAKSMTHALVGIAQMDGLLNVAESHLLPEWRSDDRHNITLQQLLEMRSGLSWVEDYVDGDASDVIEMLFGSGKDDIARYAIAQPLATAPGAEWVYSSGTTNIVTRLLGNALGDANGSHVNIERFMRSRLLDAIDMYAEPKFDAAGTFVGSSYVYATARDFAKFGLLYLRDGVCNGVRILPEGWVDHARTQHVFDEETGLGYGAHWWTLPGERNSLVAAGYEGQYIMVIPDRDLVVVRLGKTVAELRNTVVAELRGVIEQFPVIGER
jgi:CubicO group peptidase (beta-lactamase class C family)